MHHDLHPPTVGTIVSMAGNVNATAGGEAEVGLMASVGDGAWSTVVFKANGSRSSIGIGALMSTPLHSSHVVHGT